MTSDDPDRSSNFEEARRQAIDELRRKRKATVGRLWDAHDRREEARENQIATLALFSPTALFNRGAAELSWTGPEQRRFFIAQARIYDETVGRPLAESRQAFFHKISSTEGRAFVTYSDVRPYLTPFRSSWVSSDVILWRVAPSFIALGVFATLLVCVAYVGLSRLDVRPR